MSELISSSYHSFKNKITNFQLKIGIVGLGYAGLPLAIGFVKQGYEVIGIDKDENKINQLNNNISYIPYITNDYIYHHLSNGFTASSNFNLLKNVDAIIICVPTPLSKTRTPDLSFIIEATKSISAIVVRNQLVILQSTTYPGTTLEIVKPILDNSKLIVGKNLFLGYAPERIDPGNTKYQLQNTPKIVSGITNECKKRVESLFTIIVDETIPVSCTTTAETVKLHENTFRQINIALANELAIMCDHIGINAWEVIKAASTKPFGFMAHYPGPGVGGDCIPVVPHFMSWKLREYGYENKLIESSHEINLLVRHHVCQIIFDALNDNKKPVNGSDILILGVSYKANSSDIRESASLDVISVLAQKGANIKYVDPFVKSIIVTEIEYKASAWNEDNIANADCVVLLTNHDIFIKEDMWDKANLLVDTRNIIPDRYYPYKLGAISSRTTHVL